MLLLPRFVGDSTSYLPFALLPSAGFFKPSALHALRRASQYLPRSGPNTNPETFACCARLPLFARCARVFRDALQHSHNEHGCSEMLSNNANNVKRLKSPMLNLPNAQCATSAERLKPPKRSARIAQGVSNHPSSVCQIFNDRIVHTVSHHPCSMCE